MRKNNTEIFTMETEEMLFTLVSEGNESARLKIYNLAKDDVLKLARSYSCGCYTEDLESEALEILWKCIGSFRLGKGVRFRTYYYDSVRRAVGKMASSLVGVFRLSETAMEERRAIQQAIKEYEAEYGSEPSSAYLAETLGLRKERVCELRHICPYTDQVDGFFDEEGFEKKQKQFASDDRADAGFDKSDFWKTVYAPLARFSERDRAIFAALHPQDTDEAVSREEVGRLFGLSAQRVGQLDTKMLAVLRKDEAVRDYMRAA